MQYIQVTFNFEAIEDYQQDLLIDGLAEIGFNTFEDTDTGFAAFIDADHYSATNLTTALEPFKGDFNYQYVVEEIAGKNWNEEWEKNFEPLIIGNECYVRATFHEAQPQYTYQIVIDPKMAFGTGHHQTTTMMMQYILKADLQDKHVLDMGCGTGILAILATKKGAAGLVAIDNDDVCYQSTLENAALNQVSNIEARCGGKEVIPDRAFDVILANINRNILLDQMENYHHALVDGGSIFFSGFYEHPDLDIIRESALKFNMLYQDHQKIGDWVAAHFIKSKN